MIEPRLCAELHVCATAARHERGREMSGPLPALLLAEEIARLQASSNCDLGGKLASCEMRRSVGETTDRCVDVVPY